MMNRGSKKMDILECIQNYSRKHGFPPTVRELCEMTGFKSTSTIHRYIVQLKEDGLLESEVSKPRTLTIKL